MSRCADCGLPWTPGQPLVALDGYRLCEQCFHAALDAEDVWA